MNDNSHSFEEKLQLFVLMMTVLAVIAGLLQLARFFVFIISKWW